MRLSLSRCCWLHMCRGSQW